MAVQVKCCICLQELNSPGAMLLGSVVSDWRSCHYICKEHIPEVMNALMDLRAKHGPRANTNIQVENKNAK